MPQRISRSCENASGTWPKIVASGELDLCLELGKGIGDRGCPLVKDGKKVQKTLNRFGIITRNKVRVLKHLFGKYIVIHVNYKAMNDLASSSHEVLAYCCEFRHSEIYSL